MNQRKILTQQSYNPKQNIINIQYQQNLHKLSSCKSQKYFFTYSNNSKQKDIDEISITDFKFVELKTIPSSQQIVQDIQQRQNIIHTINSDLDDLFKKISQLQKSVQLSFKPKLGNVIKNKMAIKSSSSSKVLNSPSKKLNQPHKKNNLLHSNSHQQKYNINIVKQSSYNNFNTDYQGLYNIRDFQIGNRLGSGKFGQTLQARHKQTGCLFAIKKIFKSTITQFQMENQILIELEALKRLKYHNIVRGYGAFTDQFHVFVLMEYASGVSLIEKLKLSQKQTSKIIKQVLLSLKHMHQNGVVHRDLKPENIIIQDSGIIKICDFGWASIHQNDLNILCGTLDYISPQMADSKPYTKLVDLWSVGVLTYELICGKAPFKSKDQITLKEKVRKIQFEFPQNILISDGCKNFIEGFLKRQNNRQYIDWGLNHQFIRLHQEKNILENDYFNLFD